MKSIRTLVSMTAVSAETGEKIGRVKGVNVDRLLLRVTGLWISGRLGKASFYPGESILLLGERAVMISGDRCKKESGHKFAIRPAFNCAGEMIGAVTNAYCDEETLLIECLEVGLDVFSDIARGRRLHRLYTVNEKTGDTVIYEEKEGRR